MKTIYEQLKICLVMVGEDIITNSPFFGEDIGFGNLSNANSGDENYTENG